MKDKDRPLVTIGLPVFNAEEFIDQALDSILGQTFGDFEVIVSDNFSTDRTGEIARSYAERDGRIIYRRNRTNIGGSRNFNLVFPISRGTYFKWAANDDVLAPTYLEKCVNALESDPGLVLAHSKTARIDRNGEVTGDYDFEMRLDSPRPSERFADLVLVKHFCTLIFGVFRKDVLERTPLMGLYIGSDRNLLAEVGLHGRIHEVPEQLFFRRDHPNTSLRTIPNYRDRLAWFDPEKAGKFTLPYWRNGFEYLKSISRVHLPPSEKASCYGVMLRWAAKSWKFLAIDLAGPLLKRTGWGYKYYAGGYGS